MTNPFNGSVPTLDQMVARSCSTANVPGCFRYTTAENNVQYGKPSDNTNQAYQSRRLQLGFRLAF